MPIEITLGNNKPLGPNDYSVAALYSPETSTIYISNENERIVHPDGQQLIKEAFKKANQPPRRYEDFKYVAIVAEEFAHFVQHTRGTIPGSEYPVQTSPTNQIDIQTYGVEISRERRHFIAGAIHKTFEIMNYEGKPPKGLVLINGLLCFRDITAPDQVRYLEHIESDLHYSEYDFEAEAKQVQTEVLRWWFRKRLGLNFYISLS